jgi:tRNA uridine 5-carboxymethylaminomethyl modification enzyme
MRLTHIGRSIGLVSDEHWRIFSEKRKSVDSERNRLEETRHGTSRLADLLRRNEMTYDALPTSSRILPEEVRQQVEIQIKYEGYIARDLEHIRKFKQMEDKRIPASIRYESISSLRIEARQKLEKFRPDSIGQASRISGVTPADISVLLIWLKRNPLTIGN